MFRKWLSENDITKFDFSTPIFPKASDRAFWDGKYKDDYVKEAESFLGFDWPISKATDFMAFKLEGDRLRQEKPHFARRKALCTLAIGEILEHKGRFLPDIINGLFAICEETFWGISAHSPENLIQQNIPDGRSGYIDLFAAETAALIAEVYSILYTELYDFCPEILTRIEYEMEQRIVVPYLHHRDFWWMGYGKKVNNWNPWILSNIITVFLALPGRGMYFYEGIRKMIYEINAIYVDFNDDGGCDEGASYWAVSGATLFEFCEQLYTATNGAIDFFNDEKFKDICRYEYRAYIGNGYFTNFADGTPKMTHSLEGLLYLIGERFGDDKFKTFAKDMLNSDKPNISDKPELKRDAKIKRRLYEVIYLDDVEAQPEHAHIEECILKDIQVSFVREGDWYYASKGGHNKESHNHNDVGSFIAYHNNAPVLIDPSCGVYTKKTFSPQRYEIWTMQSSWHNLPEINGIQQIEGLEYKADSFVLDGKTTKISFASAFVKEAGVDKAERKISISENGIEISDCIALFECGSMAERFMTTLDVKADGNKVLIGDDYVLESSVSAKIVLDKVSFEDDNKLIAQWGTTRINRITFEYECGREFDVKFRLCKI